MTNRKRYNAARDRLLNAALVRAGYSLPVAAAPVCAGEVVEPDPHYHDDGSIRIAPLYTPVHCKGCGSEGSNVFNPLSAEGYCEACDEARTFDAVWVMLGPSDCCRKCKRVFTARELRAWRDEFGMAADEAPHMQATPGLCDACAEAAAARDRGAR